MIPWWALAILIFGANFAIWGFIGLCRHVAVLIRTVRRARATIARTSDAETHRRPGTALS